MSHISLDLKTKVPLKARLARSWPLWAAVALILCGIGWWTGTTIETLAEEQLSQQLCCSTRSFCTKREFAGVSRFIFGFAAS